MIRTKHLHVSALTVAGLALGVLYGNCSPVEFQLTEQGSLKAQGIYSYETTFSPSVSSRRPVDLIWVIDNSGSMANEAAHVRDNFTSFIASLQRSTDFKLALLSSQGRSGTAVSLPAAATGSNFLQVNQFINSTDPLIRTAEALCPSGVKCGKVTGQGTLSSFLRPDSKKVIIVVTDDESAISSDDFTNSFMNVYPKDQLSLFAFAGTSQSQCDIARVGTRYSELASETGGRVFDICMPEWSTTFVNLADTVIRLGQSSIALPSQNGVIEEILEVRLNGQVLDSSQYSFDGALLSLAPSILQGLTSAHVSLSYRIQQAN